MGTLKAAMQTVMPHHSVAVAVAGLLVQDGWNGRRHLVGGHLVGMGEVNAGELISAKHRGERL